MNDVSEPLPELDRFIHEPARLAILTVLASCERADFLFLERATGLTRGNLSVQLSRLEEAGLINIAKKIVNKRTHTMVALRHKGRMVLDAYWESMNIFRARINASAKPVSIPTRGLRGEPRHATGR